jgi:hypothetical protein
VFAKPEGTPPYNTVIWSENFSGYVADDVPSGSINNSHTGTTLYGDGNVTYGCTNGTNEGKTKIYTTDIAAGGASPEMMLCKYSVTNCVILLFFHMLLTVQRE